MSQNFIPATLLVADDSLTVRSALCDLFSREGYDVLAAGSATKALELLRTKPVDVLILDLVMEDLRGQEVIQRVKSDPKLEVVPILLLTAVADRQELVQCLDLGADDFVVKPWDRRELLGRVRAMVRLRRALDGMRTSAARARALLNAPRHVALLLDRHGTILDANAQAAATLHVPSQQLSGRKLSEVLPAERFRLWQPQIERVLGSSGACRSARFEEENRGRYYETCIYPVCDNGSVTGCAVLSADITERKETERKMAELNRKLIETSRRAGMAEIATNVLHHVGNALSRINVSSGLLQEKLASLGIRDFRRATELLEQHLHELDRFCTEDERGRHMAPFLIALSRQMVQRERDVRDELKRLREAVQRVNEILTLQQDLAGNSCLKEEVVLQDVLKDVVAEHQKRAEKLGVEVDCHFEPVPPVMADRMKVRRIVGELIHNALDSLAESPSREKRLTVRLYRNDRGLVCIDVEDNGVGIEEQNLARVFGQGYTTKKDAKGLGLHDAALQAKEQGGELVAHSDGPGLGARFTLKLAFQTPEEYLATLPDEPSRTQTAQPDRAAEPPSPSQEQPTPTCTVCSDS